MFLIDYFVHIIDFRALSRERSNVETVLADRTDYVWNPDWSHPSFCNITTDISSTAITNIYVHKDYIRITQLTIDATSSNYNAMFTDRTENISLNSTFTYTQVSLNGT